MSKIIILSFAIVVCFAALALAQQPNNVGSHSGFYGHVYYSGISCSCNPIQGHIDRVSIRNAAGGPVDLYGVEHCGSSDPGYTSDQKYYSGRYYLTVNLDLGSSCIYADVKLVSHNGSFDQEVDLNVHGNDGN